MQFLQKKDKTKQERDGVLPPMAIKEMFNGCACTPLDSVLRPAADGVVGAQGSDQNHVL